MEWIDPATCPPHKTYYGLVRTKLGTHERILQRNSDRPSTLPWEYYRNPEEGGPMNATDDQVSELVEISPDGFRALRQELQRHIDFLNRVEDELAGANKTIQALHLLGYKPSVLTEESIRELAREEINKTSWQLRGLKIDPAARDREEHNP